MPNVLVAMMSLTALALAFAPKSAVAQMPMACPAGSSPVTGTILDPTKALIPGVSLSLDATSVNATSVDATAQATSGPDGRFRFPCVAAGAHHLSAAAAGFGTVNLDLTTPHLAPLTVTLAPAVETVLDVDATDSTAADSSNSAGPTQTLSGKELQRLADDPDDLLRELQQLAAAAGGNPANVTIAVDGFQGSSAVPPKSSIAYIKINPDQFAAEYREPPFDGGRVEVYTRPGQKNYHGALFLTNGSPFENARDPFSTSKAAIGKQRYGLELSGPVRAQGSDFALTLEHRIIDNFAVVDAVTLDNSGNSLPTSANVATPQHLWLATARVDWQLGPRNTFIGSYSANANSLQNLGVGGAALAETGYNSNTYEHLFRVSDITTVSPHLMHEARLSLRFDGSSDAPVSTAPQLQVAGAFTGGGASVGNQQVHELNVEFDDDAILTTKTHSMKFGAQLQSFIEHEQLPTNFNGVYTFGGGSAPVLNSANQPTGQTATITGVEQYRRALLSLPGGSPTAYSNVVGNPTVDFSQQQNAFFFEDDWNAGHGVHIAYGVRYFFETNPTLLDGVTPRLGILWSPNKKGTWTLHAHGGLFNGLIPTHSSAAEVLREDGVARVTSTIYNPVYNPAGGNPLFGATPIHSSRAFAPHLGLAQYSIENVGGTRTLPKGWNLSLDYYIGRLWNDVRSVNINTPISGNPNGARPLAPNLDILQVQNSGQGQISATFLGIENHSYKRVQFFFGTVRVELRDDTDDNSLASPQSAYSDAGEYAHRTGQPTWNLFGNGTLTLPEKIQLSTNFDAHGDSHYNITTGFDNNGDGDFNDRPQYASPGQSGAIPTPFGLLTSQYTGQPGVNVFPRNKGVMPWTFFVDANMQRAFPLTRNPKADHPQTITVNLRSSNVLNHLNVTQVGGVLGSPFFGVPYAANAGRRIEAGLRYSF